MVTANPDQLVSVLMTCFNRENLIGASIESVLNSDYQNFELIISDDNSTDNSVNVAKQYAEKDPRIKINVNEVNLGDYNNRNRAATFAKGDYLLYVDSDDILYPHAIRTFLWCFNSKPEAVLAFADLHDHEGPFPRQLSPKLAYERHFFVNYLFGRAPGSVMIKRSVFEEAGGFSGKRYISDFEFWLKIASTYPIVLTPGLLAWSRKHAGQESTYNRFFYQLLTVEVAFAALNSKKCPLSTLQKKSIYSSMKLGLIKLSIRGILSGEIGLKDIRSAKRKYKIPIHFFIKALFPDRIKKLFNVS